MTGWGGGCQAEHKLEGRCGPESLSSPPALPCVEPTVKTSATRLGVAAGENRIDPALEEVGDTHTQLEWSETRPSRIKKGAWAFLGLLGLLSSYLHSLLLSKSWEQRALGMSVCPCGSVPVFSAPRHPPSLIVFLRAQGA